MSIRSMIFNIYMYTSQVGSTRINVKTYGITINYSEAKTLTDVQNNLKTCIIYESKCYSVQSLQRNKIK